MGRERRERGGVWAISSGPVLSHCHVGPTRKVGDRVTATGDSSEPRH